MTVHREPVETRSAKITGVDFAERTINLIVVPYNEETPVEYDGRMLLESVAPGSFAGIETRGEHVTANRDHDYTRTVGKVVSYRTNDPAGLIGEIYVSDTALGNETLRLAADGVLKGSVGMLVRRMDQVIRNGKRRINRAFVDHVALVPNPAYRGAEVLSVRQEQSGLYVADEGRSPTPNLDEILTLLGLQD